MPVINICNVWHECRSLRLNPWKWISSGLLLCFFSVGNVARWTTQVWLLPSQGLSGWLRRCPQSSGANDQFTIDIHWYSGLKWPENDGHGHGDQEKSNRGLKHPQVMSELLTIEHAGKNIQIKKYSNILRNKTAQTSRVWWNTLTCTATMAIAMTNAAGIYN